MLATGPAGLLPQGTRSAGSGNDAHNPIMADELCKRQASYTNTATTYQHHIKKENYLYTIKNPLTCQGLTPTRGNRDLGKTGR